MALASVLEALASVSVFSEVANSLAPLYLRPVLQALGDDPQKHAPSGSEVPFAHEPEIDLQEVVFSPIQDDPIALLYLPSS